MWWSLVQPIATRRSMSLLFCTSPSEGSLPASQDSGEASPLPFWTGPVLAGTGRLICFEANMCFSAWVGCSAFAFDCRWELYEFMEFTIQSPPFANEKRVDGKRSMDFSKSGSNGFLKVWPPRILSPTGVSWSLIFSTLVHNKYKAKS